MADFRIIDLTREDFDFILSAVKLKPSALKLTNTTDSLLEKLIIRSLPEGDDKERKLYEKKIKDTEREAELRKEEENSTLVAAKIVLLKKYFEEHGYLG